MSDKDYYTVLNVSRDATKDEIKRAYRKLAQKYHPDVNKEPYAEEKMKEVNVAYSVLGDTDKRAHYDRFGSQPQQGNPYGQQGQPYSGQPFTGFEDIFAEMLRQQQAQQRARQQSGQQQGQYRRPISIIGIMYRFILYSWILQVVLGFLARLFVS